jgi:hypothetical protein
MPLHFLMLKKDCHECRNGGGESETLRLDEGVTKSNNFKTKY